MKRLYLIFVFSLCTTLLLVAQSKFGVSLAGLTTYQFDNVDITTSMFSGGAEFGGVYQLQKNSFLFKTGFNINYSALAVKVDTMSISADMIDTEGTQFTYRGVVYDRRDRADLLELSLPVMFGFNYSSFYALVGAKFAYPLRATTCQTARLTSYGDYNGMFYEDFYDMPQHGYANAQPQLTRGVADFLYDLRACVELGAAFSLPTASSRSTSLGSELAFSLFAEYGLMNVLSPNTNDLVEADYSRYMTIEMNHVYSTILPSNAFVNNLRIGVRATLLFNISAGDGKSKKKCMCINSLSRKR